MVLAIDITSSEMIEEEYVPPDEDVALVAAQAGVDEDLAREALKEVKGDLAKAILLLKSRRS